METLGLDQPRFIFYVRSPGYTRVVGLFLIAIMIAPLAFIVANIGIGWIPSNFLPSLILLASTAAGILFALWLLFPTKSSLARFEFTRDHVRFNPNLIARSIGEQPEETVLSSQTAEILICQRLVPEKVYGYRIIVRASDGSEREVASHSPHTQVLLNAPEIESMAESITLLTGLPVRIVTRQTLPTGAIEDTPWIPSSQKRNPLRTAPLATVTFPYVGGILMGCLSLNPAIIVAVGFALWLCMVFSIYLVSRTDSDPKRVPLLKTLATLVTFSAAYTACFFFTAYLRGRL
jgi:hypothetical protein